MGAGDIFRGVAQGLLGAGSGAANYALERDAELRKQQMLMELYGLKQQMTPLEEEEMRAKINWYNQRAGKVGRGAGKMIRIVNDNTGMIRFVEQPIAGETLQLEPGERVISTASGKIGDDDDFANQIKVLMGGQNTPPQQEPMITPPPQSTPNPTKARIAVDEAGKKWLVGPDGKVIGPAK